jgi:RND family efflux transporter MFP subunit
MNAKGIPMIRRLMLIASCPLFLTASAVFLSGCTGQQTGGKSQETPKVTVSEITLTDSADREDFTGRVEPLESVEVKARATGYLDEVRFKDGENVKKGDVLFKIDDRTYKTDLARAEGDVSRLQASLDRYNADLARARRLRVGDAMSREDYDKTVASKEETAASLASARAVVDRAKLNLGFCTVDSPIDGRVSRTLITKGNLVTQDQTTLTTIVTMAPIWVYFDVDERTVLRIQQLIARKKVKSRHEANAPVFVGTQIETGYPHEGVIDFVDTKLDSTTGTLRVRGIFPNKDQVLSPGLSVRVRVPIGQKEKTILVSERAVGSDLGEKFLYVVNSESVVEQHPVKLGALRDGLRVVESGVKPGDWVIVRGLQRVRPGDTVDPERVPMPKPPPAEATGK